MTSLARPEFSADCCRGRIGSFPDRGFESRSLINSGSGANKRAARHWFDSRRQHSMTDSAKKLVLVDGSSYLFRAFFAMPTLTNSKGEPTGAVYGVVNMLKRLMAEHQPEYVAVVFDAPGKTFRDDLYGEYKANRPSMPDELRRQIEPMKSVVTALGLPMLIEPGVEADDVIGTLSRRGSVAGLDVIMSTGDKDMAQLVNERVTMVNTMDDAVLDPEGVRDKFGVPPDRIIDYLTLVGDSVDNIPGVPKVGPKTAVKWLSQFGDLDGVVAAADDIKGKVGENLRASLEQIPLSRDLVTIRCELELEHSLDDLAPRVPDTDALRRIYGELEFKTWLGEILDGEGSVSSPASGRGSAEPAEYQTILTADALEEWIEALRSCELFAFDTETTSLDYMQAELVGFSFAVEPGKAAYLPVGHKYLDAPPQLDLDFVLERLGPVLEDPTCIKVGQNLKYDMSVLARYGVTLAGVGYDTMLESYVMDSTASRHDMDSLALKYLSHRTIHFEDVAGKGAKQLTFDQVPIEQASDYAAEDAEVTLRLHQALWPRLVAEPTLRKLFEELEMPLVSVLSRVERNGVRVDRDQLARQSAELAERMVAVEQEAHAAAGHEFNLGSPKQIQAILFEEQGLPVVAKTPKGQPSTAESVLQELAHDYDLPRLILEYRAISKLKSTYTDALPTCINPVSGRVHTSYHQAVASTGRLSSSDPNLQNIPIRRAEGRKVRQAFVAEPNHVLLAADYSQIELRIMAHLSGDQGLLSAFAAGADIHRATAAEVFSVDPESVSEDQRRSAKAINFGLIYGMSAFGLGRQLGIGRSEAQAYVDLYFDRYPGVKAYMDDTRERARDRGYVETVFGRRLYVPEITSRNAQRRQYAERTAINAPMQGSAADIIKRAMLGLDAWLSESGSAAKVIMQVHDELVLEVPDEELETVRAATVARMSGAAELQVPLLVEVGVGSNWDEAH